MFGALQGKIKVLKNVDATQQDKGLVVAESDVTQLDGAPCHSSVCLGDDPTLALQFACSLMRTAFIDHIRQQCKHQNIHGDEGKENRLVCNVMQNKDIV